MEALSEEFSASGLKIDLTAYVRGRLTALNPDKDSDTVIDSSIDSRTESRTEDRKRTVTRRASGWNRLFNPKRWFNPEYKETEYYQVVVEEKVTFISRHKMELTV